MAFSTEGAPVEMLEESEEDTQIFYFTTFNPSIHYTPPSREFKEHLGFGVYTDIFSRYVWRGLLSSEGAVWQPSISFEAYGVGINVWANFPLIGGPNQGQFNEVDFTLYYHRNFKKLSF